jgi:photosystem II stability/assembly factor-like uncharacterized protein
MPGLLPSVFETKIRAMKKPSKANKKGVAVLVGTRKGGFILRSDASRRKWKMNGPHFLGCIIHHMVLDPRDGKTLLAAVRTGHLGPTVQRSTDLGKTWKEVSRPPSFPKAPEGQTGKVVDHVFWLAPGHDSQKNVWYAGTSPQGLFRSNDGGNTWDPIDGFNNNSDLKNYVGSDQDLTPDGGKTHSVQVDPGDPNHLYVGLSAGGFLESRDAGRSWTPLNKGCDRVFPVDDPNVGHDPHCVRISPAKPDRLYMQNHCGIYRIDRPSDTWVRIGKNMPKAIGDIGFPMTVHPRDPETAWVFPFDGSTVWPRVSPDGKPAAYRTSNGGKTWQRQDKGLPKSQAWLTVKRQAMRNDDCDPVGLYFGTTSGEVWASRNEGSSWARLVEHLPHIYSIETARV